MCPGVGLLFPRQPDVRATVSPRVADLVRQGGAFRFVTEIHNEVLVKRESAIFCIHINNKQHGTFTNTIILQLVQTPPLNNYPS